MPEAIANPTLATDMVLEAVFRYQVVQAGAQPDEAICLRVRRLVDGETKIGDASEALFTLFRKDHPSARQGSECRSKRGERATEIATGAPALILDIGPVTFRSDSEAVLRGGFSRGGWSTSQDEFEVAREGEAWVVKKVTLKRIT